jgi:hypothetical protein
LSSALEEEPGWLDFEAGRGDRGGAGMGSDEISVDISSGLSAVVASSSSVGMLSVDIVLPHLEQNRASGGSSVPQE